MRHADLRRAAVFRAVAAAGGIAAASPRLGKSPPVIHHDLKRFEAEIGRPLFERAGRALRLTAVGQALFESVGRALDEVERTRMRLAQEDPALRPLRIATVSAFGRYRLAPRLMASLPADRPLDLIEAPAWRERVRVVRPPGLLICVNTLHLLGLGAALVSADADTIRSGLAVGAHP